MMTNIMCPEIFLLRKENVYVLIMKKIGMEWSVIDGQVIAIKHNLPLSLKKNIQSVYSTYFNIWIRNLESYESSGTKTSVPKGEWRE